MKYNDHYEKFRSHTTARLEELSAAKGKLNETRIKTKNVKRRIENEERKMKNEKRSVLPSKYIYQKIKKRSKRISKIKITFKSYAWLVEKSLYS